PHPSGVLSGPSHGTFQGCFGFGREGAWTAIPLPDVLEWISSKTRLGSRRPLRHPSLRSGKSGSGTYPNIAVFTPPTPDHQGDGEPRAHSAVSSNGGRFVRIVHADDGPARSRLHSHPPRNRNGPRG